MSLSANKKRETSRGERICQIAIVLLFFLVYFHLATVLPMNQAPDEAMRYDLTKWIYENGQLPIGNEEDIVSPVWGFSYAYTPYLPSMLAAIIMRVAAIFGATEHGLLVAARMVSVLATCGSVWLCFRIGELLFRRKETTYLFAMLVGVWPQVIFLSAYHNNDSLSLFSCFLIFYNMIVGRKEHWPVHRCVSVGFAISLCLLTYYYAYGWIVVSCIFCVVSCVCDTSIEKKARFIVNRTLLVFGIVLLCAGWYFLRNAIIYDGDVLGMRASGTFKNVYAMTHEVHWPNPPMKQGMSLSEMLFGSDWVLSTAKSFIGKFGYMTIELPNVVYFVYGILLFIGIGFAIFFVVCKRRGNRLLIVTLVATSIIPVLISVYGSYTKDYQPQGRYIISALPSIVCASAFGYEEMSSLCSIHLLGRWQVSVAERIKGDKKQENCLLGKINASTVAIAAFLCLSIFSYWGVMLKELPLPDEIRAFVSEDCAYLDLCFSTSESSDGVFFVVCNEGFDIDGRWFEAEKRGGIWHRVVNLSDYGKEGTYTIHIYRAYSNGEMKFAGEITAYASMPARMNLILTERGKGEIKLYPIEAYETVIFEIWKANTLEPINLLATFDEEEQCWTAGYSFQQGEDYTILAYSGKGNVVFIGGAK